MTGQQALVGVATIVVLIAAVIVLVVTQGQNAVPPLLALGVLILSGIIVLIIVSSRRRARTRRERLDAEIDAFGFEVEKKPKHDYAQIFKKHKHLRAKQGKVVRRYTGRLLDGRPVVAIDHQYIIMAGTTPATIAHRAAIVATPDDWPRLELRPRHFGRFMRRLRRPKIELESDRFNERYKVVCERDEFAIALLTPELQEFLAANEERGGWHLENGHLAYVEQAHIRPGDLERLRDLMESFIALSPAELWGGPPVAVVAGDDSGIELAR
ncbi:MAG: hypothetical protein ACF8PN_00045 [Phycisphaerales bacterium]